MKQYLLAICFALGVFFFSSGQNLFPNGDFEEVFCAPTAFEGEHKVIHPNWYVVSLNYDTISTFVGVENPFTRNLDLNQVRSAISDRPDPCGIRGDQNYDPSIPGIMPLINGMYYLTSAFWFDLDRNTRHLKFGGRLQAPLQADSVYVLHFDMALRMGATETTDQIRVILSEDSTGMIAQPGEEKGAHLVYQHPKNAYLLNYYNWETFSSCFRANGGESYLHIALSGLQDDPDRMYIIPDSLYFPANLDIISVHGTTESMFFHLDNVGLEAVPSGRLRMSYRNCRRSCVGFSVADLPDDVRFRLADTLFWADGTPELEREFTESGVFTLIAEMPCGRAELEVDVILTDCPMERIEIPLEACEETCYTLRPSESLQIEASRFLGWADGYEGVERTVDQSGEYVAWIATDCDSLQLSYDLTLNDCVADSIYRTITYCEGEQISVPLAIDEGWMTAVDWVKWNDGIRELSRIFPADGIYELQMKLGCDTLRRRYEMEGQDCEARLYIPNAFSPNGDGANDRFEVYGKNIRIVRFQVYDRYGAMVYDGQGAEASWDGRYKGQLASKGVYVYRIVYEDRKGYRQHETGTVALL